MGKIKAVDIISNFIQVIIWIRYFISAVNYSEEYNMWAEKEDSNPFLIIAVIFVIILIVGFLFSLFDDKKLDYSMHRKNSRFYIIVNLIGILILLCITEETVFSFFYDHSMDLDEASYGVGQFKIFKEHFLIIGILSLIEHLITYFIATDYVELHVPSKENNNFVNSENSAETSLQRCEHCNYVITNDQTHCSMCGNKIDRRH